MPDPFDIYTGLARSDEERFEYASKLTSVFEDECHKEVFNFLYGNLSVLDDKSSALLTFNSVFVAIASIYIVNQQDIFYRLPFFISIFMLIISCALCMKIIWVHWSSMEDMVELDKHIVVLVKVRFQRTILYRISWWLSIFSIVILVFSIPIVEFFI